MRSAAAASAYRQCLTLTVTSMGGHMKNFFIGLIIVVLLASFIVRH
jgi:hypothetical protein